MRAGSRLRIRCTWSASMAHFIATVMTNYFHSERPRVLHGHSRTNLARRLSMKRLRSPNPFCQCLKPQATCPDSKRCQKCGKFPKLRVLHGHFSAGYVAGRADSVEKWIPCSERLPLGGYGVLLVVDGRVQYGWLRSSWLRSSPGPKASKWSAPHHVINGNVTHWRSLPDPPKETR